jgi:D-alanyl-D-alanine carboxypeptidase/D-alanyl-D-alanine-endopeptidase (penicillin-binding protein 4)
MKRTAAMVLMWGSVWAQTPGAVSQGSVAVAGSQPAVTAEQAARLQTTLDAMTSDATAARAHWGVMVTALDGTRIAGVNERQLFQPASNAKLYTTAAAMALLGPDQRFTTRVEYGSMGSTSSTVKGDVTIIGDGDANLSGREIPYRSPKEREAAPVAVADPLRYLAEFADEIAKAGVKRITGDIVGDDTVFPWEPYPEDWAIDDMVWGYGAPVSGLTINDNQIKATVRAGKSVGEKPTVLFQPAVPGFYAVDATGLRTGGAKSGDHVQMERAVGSRVLRIYGSLGVDAAPEVEEVAIDDPAEFAAAALKMLLEVRGVKVDGVARAKHRVATDGVGFREESRRPVAGLPSISPDQGSYIITTCNDACPNSLSHLSQIVAQDIVVTNKVSQNLHAELLLHQLGEHYGAKYFNGIGGDSDSIAGSTAEGVRVVRQFWVNAGVDPGDFVFFDGSGLSGHDLVTPRATAKVLVYAAQQPWFGAWFASLPVGGVDGSLESRFAPGKSALAGHVFAKTGTLGEARALSGYVDCASGRRVIFSVMVGDFVPGDAAARDTLDRIVETIAASL